MTYRDVLSSCSDQYIGEAVLFSLDRLFQNDYHLLVTNASEQAIAARLARYLEDYFPNHNIDVEYNRMGDAPKTVTWSDEPRQVFPDIIVHSRNSDTNILAIELKKTSNPESRNRDLKKLSAYRIELGYLHALFLRIGVGDALGTVPECQWIEM